MKLITVAVPWATTKKDFAGELYYEPVVHDAQRAIADDYQPALRRFKAFIADAYRPKAPDAAGLAPEREAALLARHALRARHARRLAQRAHVHDPLGGEPEMRERAAADPSLRSLIDVVPFGLPGEPAAFAL